jgi:hypothetical protein
VDTTAATGTVTHPTTSVSMRPPWRAARPSQRTRRRGLSVPAACRDTALIYVGALGSTI